jgi:hypothetical protein
MKIASNKLISVLHAEKPAADRADKLRLYGRFIGDWETRIIAHAPDGARHEGSGEIHFGWILEGRAIQDVWMIPRLAERPCAAFSRRRQLVWNDHQDLRPHYRCLAHLLDRSGQKYLSAANRAAARRRHRAGGQDRDGRAVAMELYQCHAEFISLAW